MILLHWGTEISSFYTNFNKNFHHEFLLLLFSGKLMPNAYNHMDCSIPGSSVLHYIPEFDQIHVHSWWFYLNTSSTAAPSSFYLHPSQHQGVFQWFSSLHQVAKALELSISLLMYQFCSVQSFSSVRLFATPWITACQAPLSITNCRSLLKLMPIELVMPLGLISFTVDWFDLLAIQGTLERLLQHHNLKTSVLQHSAFFMVHISYLYMTTTKTIALTIQTF